MFAACAVGTSGAYVSSITAISSVHFEPMLAHRCRPSSFERSMGLSWRLSNGFGAACTYSELRASGETLNPAHFKAHLEKRYLG